MGDFHHSLEKPGGGSRRIQRGGRTKSGATWFQHQKATGKSLGFTGKSVGKNSKYPLVMANIAMENHHL
jgi:hypothetical protein